MNDELKKLYLKIKEGKINHEESIEYFKELEKKIDQTTKLSIENSYDTSAKKQANSNSLLFNQIKVSLVTAISDLLKVKPEEIDDLVLCEHGLDIVKMNKLAQILNQEYGLELTHHDLAGHLSFVTLIEYLIEEYRNIPTNLHTFNSTLDLKEDKMDLKNQEAVLLEKTAEYIKRVLSSVIKLPSKQIETKVPLEKYGIDSMMVLQMTEKLEKEFGPLPKTLFFEFQNIQEVSGYFVDVYRDQLMKMLQIEVPESIEIECATSINNDTSLMMEPIQSTAGTLRRFRNALIKQGEPESSDIAIIGLAGRYPGAKNIQEFWENLRDGKDCITEVPRDRWDYSLYPYSRWGGFLDGVNQFDPLFFNISPRDAEIMDPQERLFLQCAYETLEDAGYTRESLGKNTHFNVGVFVGVMYQEYQLYGAQAQLQGQPISLSGHGASIANRVSYFFNFNGPSMAVDTMCSSSLTAIHLACQNILQKSCEVAIAGGVNVSIHPNKYLALDLGKFASTDGRCRSFGQGGDGYVPGEGVGAVLLKRLDKAIADGDNIYGVIKGSALNHGGKTNGYTVPNLNAQAKVIKKALNESHIDPRIVSYVEAHGTGTSLGDPIEIAGLTKAFQYFDQGGQYCAIGSVKSNIGHAESAAGIAGLTKILLQIKHQQLVPSLHSEEHNTNIDFKSTPFVLQHELEDWKRPIVNENGEYQEYPRVAGLSAFGAGGANAHIIIEEYVPKKQKCPPVMEVSQKTIMIVVSAKNEKQLREKSQCLVDAIKECSFSDTDLTSIAYTLQVGRDAMEERLAFKAESIREVVEKLNAFLSNQEKSEGLYRGNIKHHEDILSIFSTDNELMGLIEMWVKYQKYDKLSELWVKGLSFDWEALYGSVKPNRISLPTYPFAKEIYWVPINQSGVNKPLDITTSLHPFVQQNTSTFTEQRFSSIFTGQEFFLKNHIIRGRYTMPGAGLLEMAREAVRIALDKKLKIDEVGIGFKNIVWIRPIEVQEPIQIHIILHPKTNGEITFEIYSKKDETNEERVLYSKGCAILHKVEKPSVLDLKDLQKRCNHRFYSSDECYNTFREMGIQYSNDFQSIQELYVGEGEVLAKITSSSISDQYVLHPILIDGAFQAMLGLQIGKSNIKPSLPFALDEFKVCGECTSTMWVWIRNNKTNQQGEKVQKLDIDLCNELGVVGMRMKGVLSRLSELEGIQSSQGTLIVSPKWEEQMAIKEDALDYTEHYVIVCEPVDMLVESIKKQIKGVKCFALQSSHQTVVEKFQDYAVQMFEEIKSILKSKPKGKVLIQLMISSEFDYNLYSGIFALLNTAHLENPHIIGQVIEVESGKNITSIIENLRENSFCQGAQRIRYQNSRRYVATWSEVKVSHEDINIPWKDKGVYLITGGAGGLGVLFCEEIARQVKDGVIILTGRSPLSEAKRVKIKELTKMGMRIVYKQIDVTDQKMVTSLLQDIQEEFGIINGIIHSAGIVQDGFIIHKTANQFMEVMGPKVVGLANLDNASQYLDLDFFVIFSSIAGGIGNAGQADYAVANAFMDSYAKYRTKLVEKHQRMGQTLSINWPLWKEGGMTINQDKEEMIRKNIGMVSIQTSTGIKAFYQGMALDHEQILVLEGDINRLKKFIGIKGSELSVKSRYEYCLRLSEKVSKGELTEKELIEIISQ